MKVILDTNVLMSGIFFSGIPGKILDLWADNKLQFYVSPEIVTEYQRVGQILQEKYPDVDAQDVISLIVVSARIVRETCIIEFECDDPDDRMFLECAVNSSCKLVVSGDKHLLKLDGFQGISVLKPRDFLEYYKKTVQSIE